MGTQSQNLILEDLAVFLIDMQDDFINTQEKKNLIPNQISILLFCKEKNIPVIVFDFKNHGETNYSLRREIDKLSKENVYWFKKSNNDAFTNQNLNVLLKDKKIRILLLMGINAAYCVHATAKTAIKLGYKIITSKDLIAGYIGNDELHCSGPEWYQENGMYFQRHEEIIQSVCQVSV